MVQLGINDANGDGVIPRVVVYQGSSLSEFRVTNLTLKALTCVHSSANASPLVFWF